MDLCRVAEEGIKFKGVEDDEKIDDDSIGFGDDLWYEILSRLTLKPLMISKCVCKSWHQMASKIIIQSKPKNPISGFFIASVESIVSFREHFDYLPIERGDDDDEEEKKRCCDTHILDSGDGFLLCSSYYLQKDYFLYNPITRQHVSLPTPPIPTIGTPVGATAKLVFDDESSDSYYRVIRIAIGFGNNDPDDYFNGPYDFDTPHMSVDIYSSETGKWVTSKELVLPRYRFSPYSVFFDGGIYLLASDLKDRFDILRFDVNDESCRFVWSPPGSVLKSSNCLGVCEGRLCYAQLLKKENGHCMEVWEFDDDKEWVLKYNVEHFRDNVKDFREWDHFEWDFVYQKNTIGEWDFEVVAFHPYLTALFVRRLDVFLWFDLATGKLESAMSYFHPIRTAEGNKKFKAHPFSECYIHRRL